jgi:hypothetical protein
MVTGVIICFPAAGAAQGRELGLGVIGTVSNPALAVANGYAALRTSGRTRLSAAIGAGISDQELAWRGELLGELRWWTERFEEGIWFSRSDWRIGREPDRDGRSRPVSVAGLASPLGTDGAGFPA